MSRIAWATDLHFDFALKRQQKKFLDSLKDVDKLILSGDIADGQHLKYCLQQIDNSFSGDYYFVLGNHDYYGFSIEEAQKVVRNFCKRHPRAKWLKELPDGFEELTEDVAIVGNGAWYDCRFGTADGSVVLRDLREIKDFKFLPRFSPLMFDSFVKIANQLADNLKVSIEKAFVKYDKVIAVMHIPPFRNAAWYNGQMSNRYFLPFYTSKAMGDMLEATMKYYVDKQLVVLCGHTHSGGEYEASHNLKVYTGDAEYFFPALCKEIDQSIWS